MTKNKLIALASLNGYLFFLVIIFILHFLRPDKNVFSSFVSEYAVGNYRLLMILGFYTLTAATILLLTGLLLNINASKTSSITLGIFCVGMLLVSIFPTDVPVNPPTLHGLVHAFSALISLLSIGIAMIAWGFVFKKNKHWNTMVKTSWFFGIISLLLFASLFASPVAYKGLAERILMLCDIVWLMIISRKLYRTGFANDSRQMVSTSLD